MKEESGKRAVVLEAGLDGAAVYDGDAVVIGGRGEAAEVVGLGELEVIGANRLGEEVGEVDHAPFVVRIGHEHGDLESGAIHGRALEQDTGPGLLCSGVGEPRGGLGGLLEKLGGIGVAAAE